MSPVRLPQGRPPAATRRPGAAWSLGIAAMLLVAGEAAVASPALLPDWQQAQEEIAQHLAALVRIDTTNPPGNETRAARYIEDVLNREGIPAEILELEPGRGNIVARLAGSGEERPLLLMAHLDVVGVERERWTVDPFGARVENGFLYGRGAFDDKGMLAVNLEVVLLLHRLGVPLRRDVILLGEADEESGGRAGIRFLIDRHWDKIDCEYALNEGGWILEEDGAIRYVGVATGEKAAHRIRLVARGSSGHGSMPRLDNPITHLAAAVAKVGALQMPMRLNETTRAFFRKLAPISPPADATLYRDLEDPERSADAQRKLRATSIYYNAMLRTTLAPTIIKGGFRANVIPAEAEATIDVRALPGEDLPAMVAMLAELIDDPAVEVVAPPREIRLAARSSIRQGAAGRLDNAVTRLAAAVARIGPTGMPVRLQETTRAFFRQLALVSPAARPALVVRLHGNDERVSLAGLGRFAELVYRAVLEIAGWP